jgi:hypothetical protein
MLPLRLSNGRPRHGDPAMRRLAPLLFVLALAGCATSTRPTAAPEPSERYEFASAVSARRLATCAATNARSFSGRFMSDVEELVRPDNFEVVVRPIRYLPADPIIVGRTAPVTGGSHIVLYLSARLDSTERADWIARLRNGCEFDVRTSTLAPMVPVSRDTLPAGNPPPPVPASPPPPGRQPRG